MSDSKQIIIERVPAQCSDPSLPGAVISEPPQWQEGTFAAFVLISRIFIVLEVCKYKYGKVVLDNPLSYAGI